MKLSFQFHQWIMLVKFMCFLFCDVVMSTPPDWTPTPQLTDHQKTLILTFLWSPGYCKSRNCKQTSRDFVVGGLQQNYHGEKGSTEVPDEIFEKYGDELNRFWPDLKREKKIEVEKEYYVEEYKREGAYCLGMDVDEYFDLATTFARIHLDRLLVHMIQCGIEPSNDSHYMTASVALKLQAYNQGQSVDMVCEEHDGRYYLVAIRFCTKPETLQIVSCHGVVEPSLAHTCSENDLFVLALHFAKT